MTTRTITLAAIALAAFAATPASAQQTFNAWGHDFDVPGRAAVVSVVPAPRAFSALPESEAGVTARYRVDRSAAPVVVAPSATRTISVWGANVDAPAR